MKSTKPDQPAQDKIEIETACGGKVMLSDDTTCSSYQGSPVYFCLAECKVKFEADPLNSCLVGILNLQDD